MATTLSRALLTELDLYIRKEYVTHLSQTPPEYPLYTKEDSWPKNGGLFMHFIRDSQRRSILPAPVKPENAAIETQQLYEGRIKDVYSLRFATGIAFSYEKRKMGIAALNSARKPAQYLADSTRMSMEAYYIGLLAESMATTAPELISFSGQPLVSAAHPLMSGGTWSNLYPNPASPTYTVLNELTTQFARNVNEDGYPMPTLRLNTFWIPVEEEATLLEALKSIGRPDTANRADNILAARKVMNASPIGVFTLMWMPATMWFGVDNTVHSLTRYILEAPSIRGPIEEPTDESVRWQVTFWLSRANWDARGVIGVLRP